MWQGIGSAAAQGGSEAISSGMGMYAGYRIGAKADKKAFERQKWMASHAHQLEVQDLRAAGLNPILSAGGGGASFPSASNSAASTAMSGADVGARIGKALGKLNTEQVMETIENIKASTAREKATQREIEERTKAEYGRPLMRVATDEEGKTIYKANGDPVMEIHHEPGRVDIEKEWRAISNDIARPDALKQQLYYDTLRKSPVLLGTATGIDQVKDLVGTALQLKEMFKEGGKK